MNSKVPSRPEIETLLTINCGRNIKVQWKEPSSEYEVTGYQMILLKLADDYKQEFNLSKNVRNKELAVQSNTAYELQIRAENSMGFSPWTRGQWTTMAGNYGNEGS